jgi:hypothetical protein
MPSKKNYINTSHIYVIFKFTIKFIIPILSFTNSMIDLKFGYMQMCNWYMCIISLSKLKSLRDGLNWSFQYY